MQPSSEMMPYQNPPIFHDGGTAVPLGTTAILPTTTTTGFRLKQMVVVVAAMLLVVGGGTVWMRPEGASSTPIAEGLVVATHVDAPCLPATGTFSGTSTYWTWYDVGDSQSTAFETCYQDGSSSTYCWTKSYHHDYLNNLDNEDDTYRQCIPNGDAWSAVDGSGVCGGPCQDIYQAPT